jgi:hypothetical protein
LFGVAAGGDAGAGDDFLQSVHSDQASLTREK